jgi:hypothetical protein
MNLRQLVEMLLADAAYLEVMNDPLAQFGTEADPLLGAELLPERPVQENAWVEEGIRFRSVMANDGTRYSPVQIKKGVLTGSFQVILGNSDIGSEFTGQEYDALLRIIARFTNGARPSMEQVRNLIDWTNATLNMPLRMKNELQRWQAIVDAQIVRVGDGSYREVVTVPNPAGHRVNAGGTWSNDSYDPWPDIVGMVNFLRGKGFQVLRMLGSTQVRSILANNLLVRQRGGILAITGGTVVGLPGAISNDGLNGMLSRDGIPPFETYDSQYRTQTASGYYLARDVLVFVCATGRNWQVVAADQQPVILPNVIGYTAIGRPAGQTGPGRAIYIAAHDDKPPRVEGQAWQTTGPVIQEPEAFGVIKAIH